MVFSDLTAVMATRNKMCLPHGTLPQLGWPVIRQGPHLHVPNFFQYLMTNSFVLFCFFSIQSFHCSLEYLNIPTQQSWGQHPFVPLLGNMKKNSALSFHPLMPISLSTSLLLYYTALRSCHDCGADSYCLDFNHMSTVVTHHSLLHLRPSNWKVSLPLWSAK